MATTQLLIDGIDLRVHDSGGPGRPLLLLHGGGGTRTVDAFGELLASDSERLFRVVMPTHPGFDGTSRPADLAAPAQLAALYAALLDRLDLVDVLVVGNSIGGWIAAEMAVLAPARVAGFVLADAVGIEVPGHPVTDFFALTLPQVADYSYFEPDRFRIDPAALPPAVQAVFAGNRQALEAYLARGAADATLRHRLAAAAAPVLVVWGEADRMADPDYGRAYAEAIPGARFELMERTGHLPQLESPDRFARVLTAFAAELAAGAPIGAGVGAGADAPGDAAS